MSTVHLWWYLSRASGIASWACGGVGVLLGLVLSSKATLRPRPNWQLAVHRHLAMLTVTTLGLHIAATVLDGYTSFGALDVAVPFHSTWRPGAVAGGVVAAWLLAAVQLTSLLRSRLPKRLWAAVHRTSAVAYAASTWHLLLAGSERRHPAMLAAVLALTVANVSLLVFRVLADPRPAARRQGSGSARPAAVAPARMP